MKWKPLLCLLLCVIFCAAGAANAAAITVDGYVRNPEWEQGEMFVLTQQKTLNNAVRYSVAKAQYNEKNNGMYLLVASEFKSWNDFTKAGIWYSINGGERIRVNFQNETVSPQYETVAATTYDADSGTVFTECVTYVREGLKMPFVLTLCLIDDDGKESNYFTLECGKQTQAEEPTVADAGQAKTSAKTSAKSNTAKTKKAKTTTAFPFRKADAGARNTAGAGGTASGKKTEASGKTDTSVSAAPENLNPPQVRGGNADRVILPVAACAAALMIAGAAAAAAIKKNKIRQDREKKNQEKS